MGKAGQGGGCIFSLTLFFEIIFIFFLGIVVVIVIAIAIVIIIIIIIIIITISISKIEPKKCSVLVPSNYASTVGNTYTYKTCGLYYRSFPRLVWQPKSFCCQERAAAVPVSEAKPGPKYIFFDDLQVPRPARLRGHRPVGPASRLADKIFFGCNCPLVPQHDPNDPQKHHKHHPRSILGPNKKMKKVILTPKPGFQ